jgi:hypothetical protein
MGRENLQALDANRGHEPTPSPLPVGELATGVQTKLPSWEGAWGGFMERTGEEPCLLASRQKEC